MFTEFNFSIVTSVFKFKQPQGSKKKASKPKPKGKGSQTGQLKGKPKGKKPAVEEDSETNEGLESDEDEDGVPYTPTSFLLPAKAKPN